jgi:CNT family concentrative nucleoside transporter
MPIKNVILITFFLFFGITATHAQDLNKSWQLNAIENESGVKLSISDTDILTLNNGEFNYSIDAKTEKEANGDYIHQNNLLVFYHNDSINTVSRYKITELTDSTLVFIEKTKNYRFTSWYFRYGCTCVFSLFI